MAHLHYEPLEWDTVAEEDIGLVVDAPQKDALSWHDNNIDEDYQDASIRNHTQRPRINALYDGPDQEDSVSSEEFDERCDEITF